MIDSALNNGGGSGTLISILWGRGTLALREMFQCTVAVTESIYRVEPPGSKSGKCAAGISCVAHCRLIELDFQKQGIRQCLL